MSLWTKYPAVKKELYLFHKKVTISSAIEASESMALKCLTRLTSLKNSKVFEVLPKIVHIEIKIKSTVIEQNVTVTNQRKLSFT